MPVPHPPPGEPVADPPRVRWRKQMRRDVLAAARELTGERGWDRVSLSAVAAHAQVSRPSVYREFGNRAGLGRALVNRETAQFLDDVASVLGAHDDPARALEAAIHRVLTEAVRNPLIHAVIRSARHGTDSLLPYLTARADPVFDGSQTMCRAWLAGRFPHADAEAVELAADLAVRMTLSHLILPSWPPERTARRVSSAVLTTVGAR